jgi:hypothetical protein
MRMQHALNTLVAKAPTPMCDLNDLVAELLSHGLDLA